MDVTFWKSAWNYPNHKVSKQILYGMFYTFQEFMSIWPPELLHCASPHNRCRRLTLRRCSRTRTRTVTGGSATPSSRPWSTPPSPRNPPSPAWQTSPWPGPWRRPGAARASLAPSRLGQAHKQPENIIHQSTSTHSTLNLIESLWTLLFRGKVSLFFY